MMYTIYKTGTLHQERDGLTPSIVKFDILKNKIDLKRGTLTLHHHHFKIKILMLVYAIEG